jgi:hypothetical protein
MSGKNFPIERYVEQVVNGNHYKGHLKIADSVVEYELIFSVPISKLDELEYPNGISDVRKVFQFTIKKDQKEVELNDDEYSFFLHMLAEFVVMFYNNPQTQDSNEGSIGLLVQGLGPMAAFGAKASIGMTSSSSCSFNSKTCDMLNGLKFNFGLA